MYKPPTFNTPMILMKPTSNKSYGVNTPVYPDISELNKEDVFFGSFRTFGGSEKVVNGIITIDDTSNIETWFDPEIKNDCKIYLPNTGKVYDIISEPENIEMKNQYMKFKVRVDHG